MIIFFMEVFLMGVYFTLKSSYQSLLFFGKYNRLQCLSKLWIYSTSGWVCNKVLFMLELKSVSLNNINSLKQLFWSPSSPSQDKSSNTYIACLQETSLSLFWSSALLRIPHHALAFVLGYVLFQLWLIKCLILPYWLCWPTSLNLQVLFDHIQLDFHLP